MKPTPAESKRYREKHKEKIAAYAVEYAKKNRPKLNARARAWKARNRAKHCASVMRWQKENPEKRKKLDREYMKRKRNRNLNFRILCSLRSRLGKSIHRTSKSRERTVALLGCCIESFRLYMESKFESGMSWDNYGRKGWHIDHIMPCSIFDLTNPEHVKRCFHFSNMQPLWEADNWAKGNKLQWTKKSVA